MEIRSSTRKSRTRLTIIPIAAAVALLVAAIAQSETFVGTAGPDRLVGTNDSDSLRGRGGDDELRGKQGGDHLAGGPDADLIRGGAGRDLIDARKGKDKVKAGKGKDVVDSSGPDRQNVDCGEGRDKAYVSLNDAVFRCETITIVDSEDPEVPEDPES